MLKYYCASIALFNEPSVFEECFGKVNNLRKEKVLRCKGEADKKRSLLAGVLLRYALEREGLCYEDLAFSTTADGKPVLDLEPKIYFSLSHSHNYAGCLISDVPVGVDLESKDRTNLLKAQKLDRIAQKSFAEGEKHEFSSRDAEEKIKYFLECWTKKEAYSKALGKGMQMEFSQIDTEAQKDAFWSVWTSDGYCVSIYKEDENYQELSVEKLKSLSIFPGGEI